MSFWDASAWLMAVSWSFLLAPVWIGFFVTRSAAKFCPLDNMATVWPKVSVIVAARDEGTAIAACLSGLLATDYPNLEVIAVNDRSVDGTKEIMDRVALADKRCRAIHVSSLPSGWLGKNYACMLGTQAASGEYLLFTDGDVLYQRPAISHAMAAMLSRRLDHLVLLPETLKGGFWESVLMSYLLFLFTLITRFPLAPFSWAQNAFVGAGAFNLVRRKAYDAIGGHERLRMEVVDDVMLGKLIKQAGFRQEAMFGRVLIRLRWHVGVRGIGKGLEKNAFAGARYSISVVVAGILLQLAIAYLPSILALVAPEPEFFLAISVGTWLTVAINARLHGFSAVHALFFPVAAVIFGAIYARSMVTTLRLGGVVWRDTFYRLDELKREMV